MASVCGVGREGSCLCLLDDELKTLARLYGTKVGTGEAIREALYARTGCKTEECVVCEVLEAVRDTVYESIVKRIQEIAFKAEGPPELDALLDNFLLIRICRQIEANFSGIRFGGVLTYDFMVPPIISLYGTPREVWKDYDARRWDQMHFIFNVDHRMGTGQHWTSMVIDIGEREVQYFDSYGIPPFDGLVQGSRPYRGITDGGGRFLSLMREWIDDVRGVFIGKGIPLRFIYNTTVHQGSRDRSNCGPYAAFFLRQRAKRRPFNEINSSPISFVKIQKVRDELYRRTSNYDPSTANGRDL